jgi:hypothetical protein
VLALSPPRWPNIGKLCSGASAAEASSRVGVPRVEANQLVLAIARAGSRRALVPASR